MKTVGAEKLSILNQTRSIRPWKSCSETRRCVMCGEVFTGDDVGIRSRRDGSITLRCPTLRCLGGPEMWIHSGEPLISEEAWQDWEHILAWFDQLRDEDAVLA